MEAKDSRQWTRATAGKRKCCRVNNYYDTDAWFSKSMSLPYAEKENQEMFAGEDCYRLTDHLGHIKHDHLNANQLP